MIRNLNRPISPFRYWCQQALPLTFDDSLSYMELLSKVFAHLNACIADVATAEQDIVNLHNAYVQLQSYVNDYFDNLNVQTEIDHKIDEMVENGTFTQLLDPVVASQIAGVVADQIGAVVAAQIGDVVAGQIGDVVEQQIDGVVAEQIGDTVGDWLEDNLTPTTPPIDKTLTISNAAADAKTVGDRFNELATFEGNLLESYRGINRNETGVAVDNDEIALYTSSSDAVSAKTAGYYVLFARLQRNLYDEGDFGGQIEPELYAGNTKLTLTWGKIAYNSEVGQSAFTNAVIVEVPSTAIDPTKLYVKFALLTYGADPYVSFNYDFTIIDVGLLRYGSIDSAKEWINANCPNIGVPYDYPTANIELTAKPIPEILERLTDLEGDSEDLTDRVDALEEEVGDIRVGADGTTYPSAGDAVRGQVEKVENIFTDSALIRPTELNLSTIPTVHFAINTSDKWSSAGYSKTFPNPYPIGNKITIKANATNGSVVCFLKSVAYVHNTNVDYATGTGRTFIAAGVTSTFEIPSDCVFINVLDNWSGNYLPQSITYDSSTLNDSLTEDKFGLSWDAWIPSYSIVANAFSSAGVPNQGTMATASNALKASDFIPVAGKMLELLIPHASDTTYPTWGMSLYDANRNPIIGRAISAIPNRGENDTYAEWVHVYLPENAKYFRTTYWSDTYSAITGGLAPTFSYNLLKEIPEAYKPITHELPVDTYMQNSIRRARQLTDIKWTPRVNIPRYSMMNGGEKHFLDWFYADHEYVGIPYSGAGKGESTGTWTEPEEWGYAHCWVGQCIPFESFVTAARFPNSIFGETVGRTAPNYDSSPFGIVCTALVNYAVDGPLPLRGITGFFNTSDAVFKNTHWYLSDVNINNIAIGDFLYTAPHVIIITDLLRDVNGNVTHIEFSEATTVGNGNNAILGTKFGGVARRKMRDVAEVRSLYGAYLVYRRATFFGIPYVASNYVNTGNEGDRNTIVDLPCIPYLGNGAIYKAGYIHNTKICIGATGFTSLVVTKDDEPFGTFDVTGLTEVSIGFSEVGSYKAYLTDGTDTTTACYWTVE